ncbi:glycine--tRNA ligase subunit beta [Hydrogenophaga sp. A37]|uniref:glycine--tRNA ligase subunit beta n=1 Tax=Hydrogenophaga sp. A37 TaxID=1945864 RepID=UPI000985C9DD|nr:glycine--tRNA ligase subunit beta [Hydrogenophaga sp. A37]OOG83465.1 glycine--tRNA ligase subunit beta [Hydrogenophaga sp. A37]
MSQQNNLLVELFVEELPPKALKKLGDAFAGVLAEQLKAQGLAAADAVVTPFASPRRLAAHVTAVAARAADKAVSQKLMPVSVGLDASGAPTPALLKRLAGLGADASAVAGLKRAPDGKAEALFFDSVQPGVDLAAGLQKALDEAIAKLPIPKVMSYQLETDCEQPGWSSVNFVRPAHGLVALHGSDVVPVKALGLTAGNSTHGHRFEATVDPVLLADADAYAATLAKDGAVIASYEERSRDMIRQLREKAQQCRAVLEVERNMQTLTDAEIEEVLLDNALVQEVTALVERPNVLICEFEKQFLDVPQECLILTMKANQKYFPLLDAAGKLTNQFLVVSNISPADTSAVIGGNERVVRPRLADAKFFFDQDRKKELKDRVEGLSKVVYHNKLGTQGERMERVCAIAKRIAQDINRRSVQVVGDPDRRDQFVADVEMAAKLAKTDLLTDMVGEFPELQGIMGGYYARHDRLSEDIAFAIEDHYKPRFAGDELPRTMTGVVVALADKLETLVGMFGIGNLPTGDKDPFALRRHALGVTRILMTGRVTYDLEQLVRVAVDSFASVELANDPTNPLLDFVYDRLRGYLLETNSQTNAKHVDAVLANRPMELSEVYMRLTAVVVFERLPEAPALAAANKRIANILKKSEGEGAAVNTALFVEPAEKDLYAAMQATVPAANAKFDAGDHTASLQALAALRTPVDAFFDGVMVNADDPALKANRLGLLKQLHDAMNRVADLSRLAA